MTVINIGSWRKRGIYWKASVVRCKNGWGENEVGSSAEWATCLLDVELQPSWLRGEWRDVSSLHISIPRSPFWTDVHSFFFYIVHIHHIFYHFSPLQVPFYFINVCMSILNRHIVLDDWFFDNYIFDIYHAGCEKGNRFMYYIQSFSVTDFAYCTFDTFYFQLLIVVSSFKYICITNLWYNQITFFLCKGILERFILLEKLITQTRRLIRIRQFWNGILTKFTSNI